MKEKIRHYWVATFLFWWYTLGGKQYTSNNYDLILSSAIISTASWHHFSNGCFIPTIWLMSHCAISLIPLKVTNGNGKHDIPLFSTDSSHCVWWWSLQQRQYYLRVQTLSWQQGICTWTRTPCFAFWRYLHGIQHPEKTQTVHCFRGCHWVVLKSCPPPCPMDPMGCLK